MNLIFRLIIILFDCCFCKKIEFLETSVYHFRVLPFDCDINLHLTNARYHSFADLTRLYLIAQINILKDFKKNKWFPVVLASEINFYKPILPFQKFRMETRFVGWDDKYVYFDQTYWVKNQLCAQSTVKGALTHKGKLVSMTVVQEKIGKEISSPELSPIVKKWQEVHQLKKAGNQ